MVQEVSPLGVTAVGIGAVEGLFGEFAGVTFEDTSRDGTLVLAEEGSVSGVLVDDACGVRVPVRLTR